MASTEVVETAVNTNNSPPQDYTTNPDDHSNHNFVLSYSDWVCTAVISNDVMKDLRGGYAI